MQGTVLTISLNSILPSFLAQLITSRPHYTKDHKEKNVLINVFYLSFLTRFFFLTNLNEITLSKKKKKKMKTEN